ncbi:hypothetical protein B0H34DRAFT_859861 [Crassisporium funariophilum]|nr:hypothetical protein B0H34DRAFT_859861 [Crassisporium funariophilum]
MTKPTRRPSLQSKWIPHFFSKRRATSHQNLPDSPVAHLLGSNSRPTDVQISVIQEFIRLNESALSRLELGLSSNPRSRTLQRQKSELVEVIRLHQSLLSPIWLCPPEVLERIFLHVVRRPLPWNFSWEVPSLAISHVCRSWREITISFPLLWDQLPAISLDADTLRSPSYLPFLKDLLGRSRDLPLSLAISLPRSIKPDDLFWLSPAIDVLISHSERWETLIYRGSANEIDVLMGIKGRLSSLRTLTLDLTGLSLLLLFEGFKDAPQLRDVFVTGSYLKNFSLPMAQLTHYKEDVLFGNDEFSGYRHLRSLEIRRADPFGSVGPWICGTFDNLVTLFIHVHKQSLPDALFDHLMLPSIEDITIRFPKGDIIESLASMIMRSPVPCRLKRLVIPYTTHASAAGQLRSLLRLTPHLLELEIDLPPPEELSILIIGLDAPIIAPFLQSLALHSTRHDVLVDTDVLHNLADSRSGKREASVSEQLTRQFGHYDTFSPVASAFLETFRLHLPSSGAYTALVTLNHWQWPLMWEDFRLTGSFSDLSLEMCTKIPALNLDLCHPPRMRGFSSTLSRDLGQLFSTMEGATFNDVNVLQMSRLHLVLNRFLELSIEDIPGAGKYKLRSRAEALLELWEPNFRPNYYRGRWAMKGETSIVYMTSTAIDRLLAEGSFRDVIYGFKEDVEI